MSQVAISGNASGTGTLTIAAPNTNSNYTLTLPTNTGTLISTKTAGTVLQVVSTSDNTYRSTSATIPRDTSIPQITEGAQFLSLTITPQSATSYLLFHFEAYFQELTNSGDSAVFPLFKGSNANAIGGWYGEISSNLLDNMNAIFGHLWYANDTTSPTTYQVRYGADSGTLQTLGNEIFFASNQYGGIISNKLTVMEIAA